MFRPPHERLRELRIKRGFTSYSHFCSHARRQGYMIKPRRYGAIERGDAKLSVREIAEICKAMGISADVWLVGVTPQIDISMLTKKEIELVNCIIEAMVRVR